MKNIIFGVIGLIVVLGGVYVAATLNFLKVPGISPYNFGKPVLASSKPAGGLIDSLSSPLQRLAQAADEEAKKPKPATKVEVKPTVDPNLGIQKIADLWNGIDPEKLKEITAKYSTGDLARILVKMDPDRVTEFLGTLEAKRAAEASKEIQKISSAIPIPPSLPS